MLLSRLSVDELDDPLSIYEQKILREVKEDDLASAYATLEKTVYGYKHDLRYQNSPRYLKLWLVFAFCQKRPAPLLQWLVKNHIGYKLATLYEAIAYENLKVDKEDHAEAALLLGIENSAVPLKRLKRYYSELKLNHSIDFNEFEYSLDHYSKTIETSKELNEKLSNEDSLLSYTYFDYVPENINKLSWLNLQLEHNARASILREMYYQNEEVSLEELKAKHNPKRRPVRNFRKWVWKEPVHPQRKIVKQEKTVLKKPPENLKENFLCQQQAQYEKKKSPALASEKMLKQPQHTKEKTKDSLKQSQPSLSSKFSPNRYSLSGSASPIKISSIKKVNSPAEVDFKNTRTPEKRKDQSQAIGHIKDPEGSADELPYSPAFVQSQINASGARNCASYCVIKDSAASLEKMLSSWFTFDKKKNLWKKSTKKEKRSVIQLRGRSLLVIEKLGEGGMAQVYLVQDTEKLEFFGLKVQKPPNPWEFYIHYQIDQRRKERKSTFRLLPVFTYYYFVDTSCMLVPYIRYGTLLDVYNKYIKVRKIMPEPIVVFFVHQVLQQVDSLHSLDITHNDLKLDNVMLTANDKNVPPNVILIDFGHSIDIKALNHSKCKAKWLPPCSRSQYPLFNIGYIPVYADYWEVASMSYKLLYGEPMEVLNTHEGIYIIKQKIKRYWHMELWSSLFDFLLNQPQKQTSMADLIHKFDKLVIPDKFIHDCMQLLYYQ